jgi:hypothetical protein
MIDTRSTLGIPGTILRYLMIFIPLGLGGHLVFLIVRRGADVALQLPHMSWGYLIGGIVLGLMPWVTHSLRLSIWTRFLHKDVSFWTGMKIAIASDLGGAVSPTAMGGSVVKMAMLTQRGFTPGNAVVMSTLASVEDNLFFLLTGPMALYLSSCWEIPVVQAATRELIGFLPLLVLVAAGIGIPVAAWRRYGDRVCRRIGPLPLPAAGRVRLGLRQAWADATGALKEVGRRGKCRFAVTLPLTAVHWGSRFAVVHLLCTGMGISIDPVKCFALQWLVVSLSTIIPTPGGCGGVEAGFYCVFQSVIPAPFLDLAVSEWRFVTFYLVLIVGIACLLGSQCEGLVERLVRRGRRPRTLRTAMPTPVRPRG